MARVDYRLELEVTLSLDDEKFDDAEELIKARVNEMLGNMEHKDDIRIGLVHNCEIEEVK